MYLLGYDVGSSSVKASIVDAETGTTVATSFYPKIEAPIKALRKGWAEQSPDNWWKYLKNATADVLARSGVDKYDIKAIGISYQMHGLVCVDSNRQPIRDAIIWCDSRAVPYGQQATDKIGKQFCLDHLLGTPGNFTAAKLAWVKENEPVLFNRIMYIMLPGDYIAMRLGASPATTVSGLSEGMFWDFKEGHVADFLLDCYGFPKSLIPPIVPTFATQGRVSAQAAEELGLAKGTPICYRAGDQPNNALSLNVFEQGEIAATAGTSGVVYGVLDHLATDEKGRVNGFAHVNHTNDQTRLGILLCINGTGILNSWTKHNIANPDSDYDQLNHLGEQVPIGSEGLHVLPFGNGSERVLENRNVGCSIHGLNFNIHQKAHLIRATQEGIAFAFAYGMEVMQSMGMSLNTMRAGYGNMFLSPVFRQTIADTTGVTIELYDTDGSAGAARGAGIGAGIYHDRTEAFATLSKILTVTPNPQNQAATQEAYQIWRNTLQQQIK